MLFSIIIPVYNTGRYVSKCLDSCLHQDLLKEQYEIIIVNDGSTDNTIDIVLKYKEQFDNIIVISQKNKGLSAARNAGLNIAKGEYIWFVDSDDWIRENILNNLYQILSVHRLECLNVAYEKIFFEKEIEQISYQNLFFSETKSGLCLLREDVNFAFYAPTFILKRQFLINNSFKFEEGILYEDIQLIPRVLKEVKRCKHCGQIIYFYRQRQDSLIHTVNARMVTSLEKIAAFYDSFVSTLTERKEKEYFSFLFNKIKIMFIIILSKYKEESANVNFKNFVQKYPRIQIYNEMSWKEKLLVASYNISPNICFAILRCRAF